MCGILPNAGIDTPAVAEDMAISLDGATLFQADSFENTVTVIDVAAGTVLGRLPVADYHYQKRVAVTPAGRILVTDSYGDKLSIIDAAARRVTAQVPLDSGFGRSEAGAWDVATSPDGSRAYVTRSGEDELTVVDVTAGAVLARVRTGDYPRGVAVDSRGRVYVANSGSGTISVIDPLATSVLTTIPAGEGVGILATDRGGTRIAAVSSFYPNAYLIDTATRSTRPVQLPAVRRPDSVNTTAAPAQFHTYRDARLSANGDRLYLVSDGPNAVVVPV